MLALPWDPLPAAIGLAVLTIAAFSQAIARRVPNALTVPAILAAWLFAVHLNVAHRAGWQAQAVQSSVCGAAAAPILLLPVYTRRRLGAGCVKAQMAFAAWVCCALPMAPALTLVACATIGGTAITFAVAQMMYADLPEPRPHNYEFPAQITMTTVAVTGTLAWWLTL